LGNNPELGCQVDRYYKTMWYIVLFFAEGR
jgi:hypothetical protein